MKAVRTTLFILILSGFAWPLFAGGGGTIKGNILDEFNQPVQFANVFLTVAGDLRGAVTDENGKFTIKPLPPGRYDVTITFIGFDSLIIKDVRVIDERITMLRDQTMRVKMLAGPVITAWTIPIIDIDEPGVTLLGGEELSKNPAKTDFTSMIAKMVPGVYQREEGDPLQMRGSRSTSSIYFVDGVKSESIGNSIPGAAIGDLKVYTGGIPALYGDVVGGVVVVETKSFMSWYTKQKNKSQH